MGNRAFGERIHPPGDPELVRADCACVLLSPHVPMLFMGEEFAASTAFQYFCDFGAELAAAVSCGRRAEFGRFAAFASEAAQAGIPDPNLEATFLASKLRWEERTVPPHAPRLAEVRQLLAVRQRHLAPLLAGQYGAGSFYCEGDTLRVQWTLAKVATQRSAPRLHLLAHFGAHPVAEVASPPGRLIHSVGVDPDGGATLSLARGAVYVTLQEVGDA